MRFRAIGPSAPRSAPGSKEPCPKQVQQPPEPLLIPACAVAQVDLAVLAVLGFLQVGAPQPGRPQGSVRRRREPNRIRRAHGAIYAGAGARQLGRGAASATRTALRTPRLLPPVRHARWEETGAHACEQVLMAGVAGMQTWASAIEHRHATRICWRAAPSHKSAAKKRPRAQRL